MASLLRSEPPVLPHVRSLVERFRVQGSNLDEVMTELSVRCTVQLHRALCQGLVPGPCAAAQCTAPTVLSSPRPGCSLHTEPLHQRIVRAGALGGGNCRHSSLLFSFLLLFLQLCRFLADCCCRREALPVLKDARFPIYNSCTNHSNIE